jgi:Mannosyltransferase (PIG-V)
VPGVQRADVETNPGRREGVGEGKIEDRIQNIEDRIPAWARAADILALLLLAIGLLLAVFGGIRWRFLGVRLSLTSPWRVIIWALAIVVLRHLVVRRQPIYRWLLDAVRAGVRSSLFRVLWPIGLGTRLPVLLVGYFAVVTIGYKVPEPPNRISDNEFLNLPSRWDASWYAGIATYGYTWNARGQQRDQQSIVFFPAYPFFMRAVGRLLGSRHVLGGMVVSFAAFFIALIYLYGLARQWLDHEQTVTALWLLASYPFALFYSAVYTESLYLCAAVGAFFHFHRGELLKASAWGLVVGLTRPNGCFLSVPLGILALEHVFARGLGPAGWWRRLLHGHMVSGQWSVASGQWPTANRQLPLTTHHRPLATVLAAAMPGIGMLLYSLFIYNLTGDAFAWAKGHLAWGRQYGGLSNLFVNSYVYVSYFGLYAYTSSIPLDVMNAAPALFVFAMTWLVFRRFGLPYAVFLLINLVPPILIGGFLSVGRFTSVLFPAFLALALLVSVRVRPAWIAAFAMGQALNATLFFTWRELF